MVLTASQAYEIWSDRYDTDPNALLALESRILTPRLGHLGGRSVLDVATGTGRWMSYAASRGARVVGLDISPRMLGVAAGKKGISNRLVLGDACALPFRSRSVDLAICSFALSYLSFANAALGEMARVARCVVVSDLHPEAILKGWTRSFRSDGQTWEIEHYYHGLAELDHAAQAAGMRLQWTAEAAFDLPELPFFELAGKRALFDEVRRTAAVFVAGWVSESCE
jgi:ubiquinone/menaquinone biosynthesis C-methylase UbiE